jgi:NTP pyrophosphatase (non-canonical NTP hydrolase)
MNKQQFETIVKWQDEVFTKATPLSCVNHLEEEVIELKEKTEQGILDKNEIADCFLLLFGYCHKIGLSFEDISTLINDKFMIVQMRKWGKVNEKGYVKHIEP